MQGVKRTVAVAGDVDGVDGRVDESMIGIALGAARHRVRVGVDDARETVERTRCTAAAPTSTTNTADVTNVRIKTENLHHHPLGRGPAYSEPIR